MALTAVRLIARDGLEICEPGSVPLASARPSRSAERAAEETVRRWPAAGPTPRARPKRSDGSEVHEPTGTGTRIVTTKTAGFCAVCGDAFPKGEKVVWRTVSQDLAHLSCHVSVRTPEPSSG